MSEPSKEALAFLDAMTRYVDWRLKDTATPDLNQLGATFEAFMRSRGGKQEGDTFKALAMHMRGMQTAGTVGRIPPKVT